MIHLLATFALLGWQPAPTPPPEDLAKTDAQVTEVFGAELKACGTAKERSSLAQKMIDTSGGSGPAEKCALLVRARELAIGAGDVAVGIRATEAMVDAFTPHKQQDPQAWASEGHRLWNDADGRRPPERLRMRLEAAECYLRSLDRLDGLQRAAVESRLRELGWGPGPINFNFDESTEGWKGQPRMKAVEDGNNIANLAAENGCLTGGIVGGDPYIVRSGLSVQGSRCRTVEIRMAVTAGEFAQFYWTTVELPRWDERKHLNFGILGDGKFHLYRLVLGENRDWAEQTITAVRLDPGEWSHRSNQSAAFSIDFIRGR